MVLLQFYNLFCQVPILIVKENGDHTQGLGQLVDLVFCPQNPYLKASTGKTETNISETLLANQQAHLVSQRPKYGLKIQGRSQGGCSVSKMLTMRT